MPKADRAPGDLLGLMRLQFVPSYVQVSAKGIPVLSTPPKSTVLPILSSKTIPAPRRADGEAAGDDCVHREVACTGLAPKSAAEECVAVLSVPPATRTSPLGSREAV